MLLKDEKNLKRLEETFRGTIDSPSLKEREERLLEYKNFLNSFEEEAKKLFSEKMEIELLNFLGSESYHRQRLLLGEVEEKIKSLKARKGKWERFDFDKEKIKLENAKEKFKNDLAHLVNQLKNEKLLQTVITARKERREFSVREDDRFEARVIWLAIISFGEEWLLKHY
jgi:hypothetical protein